MFFLIKTFGCQMNIVDSQIVAAILTKNGFSETLDINEADIILFNTCSVRDKAEQTLFKTLRYVKSLSNSKRRLVGILGCVAQRMKDSLLENDVVDFVVGPDSYRKLPSIINEALKDLKGSYTDFDYLESYSDIVPKYNSEISAYIPISRGCDNICSYCIVPYTRGPQKDRDINSIIKEFENLSNEEYKEVTLLGENVNLYKYKSENGQEYDFADLLDILSNIDSRIRLRFISSYPKNFTDKLINIIVKHDNICNHLHLPLQSGSDRILKLMNRHYDSSEYASLVEKIRKAIPKCEISTDIITGFCSEEDIDHRKTMELIQQCRFSQIFSFIYSVREGTYSAKFLEDNVPLEIKTNRLKEIVDLQHSISLNDNKKYINESFEVLIEGHSKKDSNKLFGRTEGNKTVIIENSSDYIKIGDFVNVVITDCTSATLFGNKI